MPDFFRIIDVATWSGPGASIPAFHDWRVSYRQLGLNDAQRLLDNGETIGELLLGSPEVLRVLIERDELPGVHALASSYDVLTDDLRARLESPRTGVPFSELYCASEFTVPMAFRFPECTALHVNADYVAFEVADVDSEGLVGEGEAGRIVLTDLLNDAMPLLRYEIGDLGSVHAPGSCDCGRALPTLHLYGRHVKTALRTTAGLVGADVLLAALRDADLDAFALIQTKADSYELVTIDEPAVELVQARLAARIGPVEVSWSLPSRATLSLLREGGIIISRAARNPVAAHADPSQERVSAHSDKRAARRMLRSAHSGRSASFNMRVLDSRSMVPFFGGERDVVVRWGVPTPETAIGAIVALELEASVLVVHRICAISDRGGSRRFLEVADSYTMGNPFNALWIDEDDILGVVINIIDPVTQRRLDLTTPLAMASARLIARANRALWSADNSRLRMPLAFVLRAIQRAVLRFAYAVTLLVSPRTDSR
jgi:hypothetical protein